MNHDYYEESCWEQQYQISASSGLPFPTNYPLESRSDQFDQQTLNAVPPPTTPAFQPLFPWDWPYFHQSEVPVVDGLHIFDSQAEEQIVTSAQQAVTSNQASSSNGASLHNFVLPSEFNITFSPALKTPVHNYIDQTSPTLHPTTPLSSIPEKETLDFPTPPASPPAAPQLTHLLTNFSQPEQVHLRILLVECLSSDWLRLQQREPMSLPKQSIFLRFLSRVSPTSNFRCLFDDCGKEFDRKDRAVGHIRTHLEHKPFPCNGRCKSVGCNRRFYSRSHLAGHITSPKGVCELCEKSLIQKNLPRHRLTCPARRVDLA